MTCRAWESSFTTAGRQSKKGEPAIPDPASVGQRGLFHTVLGMYKTLCTTSSALEQPRYRAVGQKQLGGQNQRSALCKRTVGDFDEVSTGYGSTSATHMHIQKSRESVQRFPSTGYVLLLAGWPAVFRRLHRL